MKSATSVVQADIEQIISLMRERYIKKNNLDEKAFTEQKSLPAYFPLMNELLQKISSVDSVNQLIETIEQAQESLKKMGDGTWAIHLDECLLFAKLMNISLSAERILSSNRYSHFGQNKTQKNGMETYSDWYQGNFLKAICSIPDSNELAI